MIMMLAHLVEITCIRLVVILVLELVVVVEHGSRRDLCYMYIVQISRRDVKCYLVEIHNHNLYKISKKCYGFISSAAVGLDKLRVS